MHVLRNKDGQLFSKLDSSSYTYKPVWIYPGQGGMVAILPKADWPTMVENIKRNFGIELEGEIVKATLPPFEL